MATAYGEAETNDDDVDILGLSAGIVAAYVAQNTVARTAIPELIRSVHGALSALGSPAPNSPPSATSPPCRSRARCSATTSSAWKTARS
jgi:predicted transcriptional regulator